MQIFPDYSNDMTGETGTATAFEQALSKEMSSAYAGGYINGLGLKDPKTGETLTLSDDGKSGSFYDYMVKENRRCSYYVPYKAGRRQFICFLFSG